MRDAEQRKLTEKEQQELMIAYEECADGPTRTRLQAVRLYGNGYPVESIQEITGAPGAHCSAGVDNIGSKGVHHWRINGWEAIGLF